MCKVIPTMLVVVLCVGGATAQSEQNVIYQHNAYYDDPNNAGYPFYQVFPSLKQVTVLHGVAGQPFQFEAMLYDPNGVYQGPGDINWIRADSTAGPVTVTVVGGFNAERGMPYGASHVKQISIYNDQHTGTIGDIAVHDGLANDGPVNANVLSGTVTVGNPGEGGADIVNPINIEQLDGQIDCRTMGNLTVTGIRGHLTYLRHPK